MFQFSELVDEMFDGILTSICHLCMFGFFTSIILFFCTLQVLCQLICWYDLVESARTDKAAVACSDSKEHVKVCLEQENTQLDSCNFKTAGARSSVAPEENITVSGSEQKSEANKALLHSGMDEIYKSPIIPEAKTFQAVVSYVGHDGTIYIVPKSFGKIT